MSDAYRGEDDAQRARLVELREELDRRQSHLAELDVELRVAESAPTRSPREDQTAFLLIFAVMLMVASFGAFARGDEVFGYGAIAGLVVLAVVKSPIARQLSSRLAASLPEHVDEFKDPEPHEPAAKQRVEVSDADLAQREIEIEKRRAACEEIEREIADAESLLERKAR